VFGTLQYSAVYNNSPLPSPPPPSKRPRRPLYHHHPAVPLMLVSPGNLVSLPFMASCRSLFAVPAPLGLFFRPPYATSRRFVESSRRLRAHLLHPRRKPRQRSTPRIANHRHQNRSPRHHSSAPAGLFSHPLSWRPNSSRIGAAPTELGRNSLVSALVRSAGAKRRSVTLWNGDSGSANNPGNRWPDLEATLICRLVRRTSPGLQVG